MLMIKAINSLNRDDINERGGGGEEGKYKKLFKIEENYGKLKKKNELRCDESI